MWGSSKVKRLERLYRSLPTIDCQGKCIDACGPIACTPLEAKRMTEAGGPFKVTGRVIKLQFLGNIQGRIDCGYLDEEGRCRVYDVRPLICRLYGLTERMRCPFGCKPSRWLSADECMAFMKKADIIGGKQPVFAEGAEEMGARAIAEARVRARGDDVRS